MMNIFRVCEANLAELTVKSTLGLNDDMHAP